MGRNSGSSRGGGSSTTITVGGKNLRPFKVKRGKAVGGMPTNAESIGISEMKNKDTAKSLMKAVTKVYKTLGLRTTDIRLANLDGAYGVTYLTSNDGGKDKVFLDAKFFDRPKSVVAKEYAKHNYTLRNGVSFKHETSSPVQHTMTHELGHTFWNHWATDPKSIAMGKELRKVYKEFKKDKNTSYRGSYGRSSVDEFLAEMVAVAVHPKVAYTRSGATKGYDEKYVTEVKRIIKKYRG